MSSSTKKPTITLQELAKGIIDSWQNSPFNAAKGQAKTDQYKDGCWLSYCLHHAVVEAACHGLDVLAEPTSKPICLASVVDGLPKFKDKNAKSHSWNIFQVMNENESNNDDKEKKSAKVEYYCVDLSIDQFEPSRWLDLNQSSSSADNTNKKETEDGQETDTANNSNPKKETIQQQQPPCYVPVPGTARVKKDGFFKNEQGSQDWSGRGVFIAGEQFSKSEVEARRDLWPFYLSTVIACATRAKKVPELPTGLETYQDTLPAKDEATQMGSNFAFMGDRQGEAAIKPHIDKFKFMGSRIKSCKKMCAQKAGSAAVAK